jgi:hypothetical protein
VIVPVVCCATAGVAASQIEQRTIIEETIFFMPDGSLKVEKELEVDGQLSNKRTKIAWDERHVARR